MALVGLSVVVGGCFETQRGGVVDKLDSCGWGFSPPIYEIVNQSKQTILSMVGMGYSLEESSPPDHSKDPPIPSDYPKDAFISPGGVRRGWIVDQTFIMYRWHRNSEVSIVPANLATIRLDQQNTVAYYTGYPRSLSKELNSWLEANQSKLTSSFYTPKPTVDNMEAYGLFYIVRNAGRARLGLPPAESNHCDVYTSLDPLNRPHWVGGFKLIFTVNGPKKSDIHVSYKGDPR